MIRIAKIEDLGSMVNIYNQAIEAKFQTAFTHKYSTDDKIGWFHEHTEDAYPLLVYEHEGNVAGYLSISPYREGREALRSAVEVSYFIDNHHHRMGIGTQLLEQGIATCRKLGYKTVIAIILEPNIASAKLLEKKGFEKWGYLPGIADFDGVVCSQVYYGLKTG